MLNSTKNLGGPPEYAGKTTSTEHRAALLQAGLLYLRSGLSLIPVDIDKQPVQRLLPHVANETGEMKATWKPFQREPATEAQLKRFCNDRWTAGLAAITGSGSGGLLVLDFDIARFYDAWKECVGLFAAGIPVQRTGGGGFQVWLRCNHPGANQKLAWQPCEAEASGRTIAIETRAENGYAILPPSLHASGRLYQVLAGDFTAIPVLDNEVVIRLLDAARSLDEAPLSLQQIKGIQNKSAGYARCTGNQASVIETYNASHTINEELERHGYARAATNRYIRPGGKSGSVVILDGMHSYHFSVNDALHDGHKHDAFSVYCQLDHNNDIRGAVKEAAKALGMPLSLDLAQSARGQTLASQTDLPADSEQNDLEQKASQTQLLLKIATESAKLFRAPDGKFFANVSLDGHNEIWPITGRGGSFKRWLANRYYWLQGTVPNAATLINVLTALEGIAQFGLPGSPAEIHEVHTRIAAHSGRLYLDLANSNWEVIEIDENGWRKINKAPVYFRRPPGMLALPDPVAGGQLDELQLFINMRAEDWYLIASWLVGAFHPTGPYPVLALHGEHGSAKSTATRLLRSIIDPALTPSRAAPADEHNLAISAKNAYIVALDNMSHIPGWLSDAICRLATGAGLATRSLFTDDEEAIFYARRPILLNGIEELATRGDLLDRMLIVNLPTIASSQRRDEKQLQEDFNTAHPRILAGLLDVVSFALRALPYTTCDSLPRMADFALWITAASEALGWEKGAWLEAYNANQQQAITIELDASPTTQAIQELLRSTPPGANDGERVWAGLMADLDKKLKEIVKDPRDLPRGPRALSSALRRLVPSLRQAGIYVVIRHERDGSRITISNKELVAGDVKMVQK